MATERGYYREEMERSIKNIEMALMHLTRVINKYAEPHPEIASQVQECGEALVLIGEAIQSIHDSI